MSSKESCVVKTNQPFNALFVSGFIVNMIFSLYCILGHWPLQKSWLKILLITGYLSLSKLTSIIWNTSILWLCSQFKRTNLETSLGICFQLIRFCSYIKVVAFLNPRWYQDQSWDLFGLSTSLTCSSSSSTNRPPSSQGENFLFFLTTLIETFPYNAHLPWIKGFLVHLKIHFNTKMIRCDTHDKLEMLWIESQHENNLIRTLINRLLVMVMRVMSFALKARVLQKLMHDGVDGGDGDSYELHS